VECGYKGDGSDGACHLPWCSWGLASGPCYMLSACFGALHVTPQLVLLRITEEGGRGEEDNKAAVFCFAAPVPDAWPLAVNR
jgi:hypothetical protein